MVAIFLENLRFSFFWTNGLVGIKKIEFITWVCLFGSFVMFGLCVLMCAVKSLSQLGCYLQTCQCFEGAWPKYENTSKVVTGHFL